MSDPMNLKSILYETIHQNIPEVPLPASYEEHLDCMVKTFHFCHDRYLRSLHGELYLTGWHTGKRFYSESISLPPYSSPILRAWNTPFKNGMRGVFHAHTNTEFIYAADGISYFFVKRRKSLSLSRRDSADQPWCSACRIPLFGGECCIFSRCKYRLP